MFTLDSRLQQDTLLLGDLPLCRVLLMNDASYPWCILVPRRAGVSELFELSAAEQQQLEARILAGDGGQLSDIAVVVALFAAAGLIVWASGRFAARRAQT